MQVSQLTNLSEPVVFDWVSTDSLIKLQYLTLDDLYPTSLLSSQYIHEQEIVKYITVEGKGCVSQSVSETFFNIQNTIKIEQIERLSPKIESICNHLKGLFWHSGFVTAHMFISPQGSTSFPLHVDPDDVIIYVVDGVKNMKVVTDSEKIVTIKTGQALFIPKNIPHEAINTERSVMLSFGFEQYISHRLEENENNISKNY